jgi:hypothetical protein
MPMGAATRTTYRHICGHKSVTIPWRFRNPLYPERVKPPSATIKVMIPRLRSGRPAKLPNILLVMPAKVRGICSKMSSLLTNDPPEKKSHTGIAIIKVAIIMPIVKGLRAARRMSGQEVKAKNVYTDNSIMSP